MSVSSFAMQYPTSWAGDLTFEQLYADLAPYATNVMKRNGIQPHQLDECLPIGMIAQLPFSNHRPYRRHSLLPSTAASQSSGAEPSRAGRS